MYLQCIFLFKKKLSIYIKLHEQQLSEGAQYKQTQSLLPGSIFPSGEVSTVYGMVPQLTARRSKT